MDGAGDELRLVNRLHESRSPYVRGHMNNPVAWQQWTPETLALARQHNRLIFVSIGYAACHWCHVMERESFENPEIAAILNSSFIPIKIDREERPDIDRIYMSYVEAVNKGGGWPLNVFLTPDLQPLFGGTYWPGPGTTAHRDHIGFLGILEKIRDVWRTQQSTCVENARQATMAMLKYNQEGMVSGEGRASDSDGEGLDLELLEEAYSYFATIFDRANGGFLGGQQFPLPSRLQFLIQLRQYPQTVQDVVGEKECKNAEDMIVKTLKKMTDGGIHDQIGNGFARYSVTRDWSLPHFEKMLYDQAQLLSVYLDAYLITKRAEFLDTVHDIATYLTTPPLASPAGGFFSAEDADSFYRPTDREKREGAFYVWTLKEFQAILGEPAASVLAKYYNVQEHGNVDPMHDAHDELMEQNVLAINSAPENLAQEFGLSPQEVERMLREGKAKLREHRERDRPSPALDDKIVVSWNGLAIGSLARTSGALAVDDPERSTTYRYAAERAVAFIHRELLDQQSMTLKRVYREGPGDAPAFADDYAFLISGLLDLYDASFHQKYLRLADSLQKTQLDLFWDASNGGFFGTAADAPDLLMRVKDCFDSAEPSMNSVSARNLYRLSSLLEDESYKDKARRTAQAFEVEAMQHPFMMPGLMSSIVAGRLGMRSIVVTGDTPDVEEVIKALRRKVRPTVTVLRLRPGEESEWLRERNPLLGAMDPSKATVQICENQTCRELAPSDITGVFDGRMENGVSPSEESAFG